MYQYLNTNQSNIRRHASLHHGIRGYVFFASASLQSLDRHYSNVVGSRGGRRSAASPASTGYDGQGPSLRPPPQVGPPYTPPLVPLPVPRGQQQALAPSAPTTWSPWMGSWDQQSLVNSFSTMSIVPPAVTNWVANSDASNHTISDVDYLTYIALLILMILHLSRILSPSYLSR
jgi:hypothetical protein